MALASAPGNPVHRALKVVILVLGLAIASLTALMIYKILDGDLNRAASARPAAGPAAAAATPGAEPWTVALPPGASLLSEQASGGLLLLRLRLADGREEMRVLDLAGGRLLGVVQGGPRP